MVLWLSSRPIEAFLGGISSAHLRGASGLLLLNACLFTPSHRTLPDILDAGSGRKLTRLTRKQAASVPRAISEHLGKDGRRSPFSLPSLDSYDLISRVRTPSSGEGRDTLHFSSPCHFTQLPAQDRDLHSELHSIAFFILTNHTRQLPGRPDLIDVEAEHR